MVKSLTSMTYEELQAERDAKELLKNKLKLQLENMTDTKASLKLTQELLQLSKRNEKLAERQVVLLRKVKRPMARSRPASYALQNKQSQDFSELFHLKCQNSLLKSLHQELRAVYCESNSEV